MDRKKSVHHIYVISDATGETANTVTLAALSQFRRKNMLISRIGNVRTEDHIKSIVKRVAQDRGFIVYTLVSDRLRQILIEEASKYGVFTVDIIGPLLEALAGYLGKSPQAKPGLLHRIDDLYFRRIEAIDFTVKHDDGQNIRTIAEADIVLVGVSRTTKTPLSIYLAREGWKVANVPIILNIPLPQELFNIDQRKIVGLIISPEKLASIRLARLRHLGQDSSSYAHMEYITKELEYSKEIFKRHRWPVINVTNRAVEEVAHEVLAITVGKDRRI